jgi:hypothetical protein
MHTGAAGSINDDRYLSSPTGLEDMTLTGGGTCTAQEAENAGLPDDRRGE